MWPQYMILRCKKSLQLHFVIRLLLKGPSEEEHPSILTFQIQAMRNSSSKKGHNHGRAQIRPVLIAAIRHRKECFGDGCICQAHSMASIRTTATDLVLSLVSIHQWMRQLCGARCDTQSIWAPLPPLHRMQTGEAKVIHSTVPGTDDASSLPERQAKV